MKLLEMEILIKDRKVKFYGRTYPLQENVENEVQLTGCRTNIYIQFIFLS